MTDKEKEQGIVGKTKKLLGEMSEETGIRSEHLKKAAGAVASVTVPVLKKVGLATSTIGKIFVARGAKGLLEELTKPLGTEGQNSLGQQIGMTAGHVVGGLAQKTYDTVRGYFKEAGKSQGKIEDIITATTKAFSEYAQVEGCFEITDSQSGVTYSAKKSEENLTIYSQRKGLELTLVHYLTKNEDEATKELAVLNQDLVATLGSLNRKLKNYRNKRTIKTQEGLKGVLAPKYEMNVETSDSGFTVSYSPAKQGEGRFILKLNSGRLNK
ncbi:hypothetical protein HZA33_02615 [Candidatus Pacearchaeota archaeon]|nr:hypothetical protein [Candidatus Pacearchaeota archaeon]